MNDRFRSLTMRIHQTEEQLAELVKKFEAEKAQPQVEASKPATAQSEVDVESKVKLQMLEHRLNGM